MPSLSTSDSVQVYVPDAAPSGSKSQQHQDSIPSKASSPVPLQQAAELFWPAIALLCWTVCSSGLILLNKELMVADGFKFPMALTAAGQLTSYLGGSMLNPKLYLIAPY